MQIDELKNQISEFGKKLYEKGLSPGFSGNISIRFEDKVLITPSGKNLGDVSPDEVSVVDFKGNLLEGLKASSEKTMHFEIYKKREDINAIIHCHAPKSSAFAVCHKEFKPILAETIYALGDIPIAKYHLPSTDKLALEVAKYFDNANHVLMANHGIVTGASDLKTAFFQMETIEYCADVYLNSKILGKIKELSKPEVKELEELSKKAHSN